MDRVLVASGGTMPRSWRATSVSVAVHGAVLAGFCTFLLPRRLPPPPPPQSIALVMQAPDPVSEQNLAAAEVRPAVRSEAVALTPPLPRALAAVERPDVRPVRRTSPIVAPAPVPAVASATAPVAAVASSKPAASPAAVPHDLMAGLEARIRQAVQEAAVYPASARVMRLEGRTQVRFDYTDGLVGSADVSIPSNSPVLDRAALAAVRRAVLPHAPAEIGARRLALLVWVDFRLVRQD